MKVYLTGSRSATDRMRAVAVEALVVIRRSQADLILPDSWHATKELAAMFCEMGGRCDVYGAHNDVRHGTPCGANFPLGTDYYGREREIALMADKCVALWDGVDPMPLYSAMQFIVKGKSVMLYRLDTDTWRAYDARDQEEMARMRKAACEKYYGSARP